MAMAVAKRDDLAHYEKASPASLIEEASSPEGAGSPDKEVKRQQPTWLKTYYQLEQRLGMLRQARLPRLEHWALISQYIQPRRSIWMVEGGLDVPVPNSAMRGLPINQSIVDPTGTYASQVAAAGLFSGNIGPSKPWFTIRPTLEDDVPYDALMWLEGVERMIYGVLAQSNFYDSACQVCEDCVNFGTGTMIIYEDDKDVIRCYVPMIGEFFLQNGGTQRPEVMYRTFTLTVGQIVERFGLENCPREIQDLWAEKGAQTEIERIIAHAIEPNFPIKDRAGGGDYGFVPGGFTYREMYWVYGVPAEYPLSVRGFYEIPFIAPRWVVSGNDPYGWSPAMMALPDIVQLQQETRRKAEFLEKMVRPPMNAPVELKNQPSSIQPGGITYTTNPAAGMTPVFMVHPQGFQSIVEDIREVQLRIKQGFFNDLFLLAVQSSKDETAFEVAAKQQEKLQALGPVIERFQVEMSGASIRRVFQILKRRGMIPPVPKSLRGKPIDLKYISTLALAQKASQTAGIERLFGVAGHMAAVKPEVLDLLDFDAAVREYGRSLGVTGRIVRAPEQVAMIRKQKAAAAQQAQQAATMSHMATQVAPGMAQAAKNLSDTDTGGGINALQAMLGNGAAGGNA